jgi:hypothetical protein
LISTARAKDARDGLSADLSLGVGVTHTTSFASAYTGSTFAAFETDDVAFAVLLPALSVGGWVAPQLSLGARITNFWFVPDGGDIVNGYLGAEVLVLPVPAAFFGWGVGLLLAGETFEGADAGIGGHVRGALVPLERGGHRFGIFAETVPGFVEGDFLYSAGAGLVWVAP